MVVEDDVVVKMNEGARSCPLLSQCGSLRGRDWRSAGLPDFSLRAAQQRILVPGLLPSNECIVQTTMRSDSEDKKKKK